MAVEVSTRSTLTRNVEETAHRGARLAGLLFLGVSGAFLTVTMLAASIAPDYDFHGAAISDLGVIAETAGLFNGLLVAIGLMNAAAGYLLYRGQRRPWRTTTFVLAGVGAVGAGLFPLSTGGLHTIFALLAFVGFNLEVLVAATTLIGPMRVLGYLAGGVGLLYAAVMVAGDSGNAGLFGPIGHGGSERMIAYPAMLWLLAFGGSLSAPAVRAEGARSSPE